MAPAILHMFHLEITEDIDGKVLTSIFKPGSPIAERRVIYRKITEEEKIKEKLRKLKL